MPQGLASPSALVPYEQGGGNLSLLSWFAALSAVLVLGCALRACSCRRAGGPNKARRSPPPRSGDWISIDLPSGFKASLPKLPEV